MVGDNYGYTLISVQASPHVPETGIGLQQVPCGSFAERDDKLGTDHFDLPGQVGLATLRFLWRGFAVTWGPALYDVRNVNIAAAFQIYGRQQVVKQLTGWANERLPERIFLNTRAFAHVQPVRVSVSNSKYRAGT